MQRAYARGPEKLYFVGSSEGGREGLTMAQRYPADFDGIFSRVPVINWTALQFAGTRNGLASMGDAWIRPPLVKLVGDEVLAACDLVDGLGDGIVSDPKDCLRRFDGAAALRRRAERRLPDRRADQGHQDAAFAVPLRLRPGQRRARVPGLRRVGRGHAGQRPHRRLERLVVGPRGAGDPAGAGQRHRLVLRQRCDPVLLRPRPRTSTCARPTPMR